MLWAQDAPQDNADQPPHSDVESSSNDTKINTAPPPNDAKDHPNSDVSDILEFHSYDPMKALKDIEVGDYYFHLENYKAAQSRYEEALMYKPKDAEATFKLAQADEKLKNFDEAREYYTEYLKILPDSKKAEEARKALERIQKESSTAAKK